MKILFLCNKSPWPAKEGGPMAMNMLVEGLIDAGHTVKVLAVNSYKYHITLEDIPVEYRLKTGIELIDVDLRLKPCRAFIHLFTGKSYHVQRFISGKFRTKLEDVLKSGAWDVVQLETLFMTPYIETIREHSEARIFLRAHNIEHRIWERVSEETVNPFRRWYICHLAKTLKNYEQGIIPSLDGIIAITPTDADYFRELKDKNQKSKTPWYKLLTSFVLRHSSFVIRHSSLVNFPAVIDIPYGVDPQTYRVNHENIEFPSLFTLGAMNWIPNQDGVRWFLMNVWPDVHRHFPALRYYLAGREMPGWMRNLTLENVIILGEVEDARAFISSKAMMIVPLFSGSGIRIKIIEGLAMGKTIISTTLGAEGIEYRNGENLLIANLPCEFYEMISISAGDRDLIERIGKEARKLIETKYDSKILIQKLCSFYQQVAR